MELEMNSVFLKDVEHVLSQAKQSARTAVNLTMVYAYYEIGKMIVEEEQKGKQRAEYGAYLLKGLSQHLTKEFGKGYSVDNLKLIRKFYCVYSCDSIGETVFPQFKNQSDSGHARQFYLSWSHYLRLMRIKHIEERHFYEIEAVNNGWSLSEMNRQIDSALFERLALSKDKEAVMGLALKGHTIEKAVDLIKDPYILEFLDLPEDSSLSEIEMKTQIINHLHKFMMELGKGFTFVGRQVRLTFEEEHYWIDLVFYNRILRCFVLLDLKIGKLKHQDLGQMQMYVNYYDRKVKLDDENPTIGIVLCKDKKESVVKMTLPKDNNQIFASQYQTVLPSKEELKMLLEEKGNEK